MKVKIIVPLLVLFLLVFSISLAETSDKIAVNSENIKIEQVISNLNINNDAVKEIRRDQLNYKIEKEILKETYSSNIQTINILIAIILAVFTIIGFLGIKGIFSIKNDFKDELNEIRRLRSKYELKFSEIEKEQFRAKEEYAKLRTSNEDQEVRLKVLEIQEKASSLIVSGNFERALSYITLGLKLEPKDTVILYQKQYCHMKLKQFSEAILVGKILFEIEPDNLSVVANQCELYLITGNVDEFDLLFGKYKVALDTKYTIYLGWYFNAVKLALKKDLGGLKKHIEDLSTQQKPLGKLKRVKWDFADIRGVMDSAEPVELKNIFEKAIFFLEGGIEVSEIVS